MQAARLSRENEEQLLMFPKWGRTVETSPVREDGTRLGKKLNGKHQSVPLGDVKAWIINGNAELSCVLTAVSSSETVSLKKKIGIARGISKITLRESGFKKWTPDLKKGGDLPKDLIGRWKMFTAEKLVVAYLLSLKIGFLLYAKILN